MNPSDLIPATEAIPAPSGIFIALGLITFTLHILIINTILGGGLITLFSRLRSPDQENSDHFYYPAVNKIPTMFALGVNLGVAPLLFIQVIYGHLFYTSSILMASFWIMIIPLLIIAYYGAYIHARKYFPAPFLSKSAILITILIVLYIGFIFVNNLSLMVQPEKWTIYFDNRSGIILNLSDITLMPRYLHFITASLAVGGLFLSLIWTIRQKKEVNGAAERVKSGLKIFGYATLVQIGIGLWYLLTIPRDFMLQFMGGNIFYTIIFLIGFLTPIGAVFTAFKNKFRPTLIMFFVTIVCMGFIRYFLKIMYLDDHFSPDGLTIQPQYGVMALFFIIFIAGLFSIAYMVKIALSANRRRAV
ncbi:MAG: hypothetical protein JXR46_07680 [Calditrichaceae bacterium]|nr:hypothetical protein [Calditrichaceae bacterium]MBN2708908.1 hypothetical protein [Calditrichaceae bacterium]RQV97568.1 MAG: hypothetical protein EH224_00675 [Calditrichota bacterium]